MKWLEEDLQRNKTRLLQEPLPQEDGLHHQETMMALQKLLEKLAKERQGREELEQKISSLESTLMKERAEHTLSLQQLRQRYEQAMREMGARFEMRLKTSNEQLIKQSQKLEEMLKDVFQSVESRLASGSFSTGAWVPIVLENREHTMMPSWMNVGTRAAEESVLYRNNTTADAESKQVGHGSMLVQSAAQRSPPKGMMGGSLKLLPKGPAASGQMSSKAITDILHRLHEENQQLMRTNQELNQRHQSRKGSKEASKNASRNSPITTPGAGIYAQWPVYRPAG